jgi:hypothetical protein
MMLIIFNPSLDCDRIATYTGNAPNMWIPFRRDVSNKLSGIKVIRYARYFYHIQAGTFSFHENTIETFSCGISVLPL